MKKMTSLCLALVTGMTMSKLVAQTLPVAKAEHVSKDSVAPPAIISLRGELAEFDANPNVNPVGPTTTRRLPSNLKIVTLGKEGVPGPRTIESTFKKIPVRYTQPVAVEEPQVQREALYTTRYFTEDEGLKASTITSLLEDSRGHLWIAADQGGNVCRHDGERVICFSQEQGFPLTWGIRSMLEDRQGRIWFSGERGVCFYDGHHFWHYERAGATGWENVAGGLLEDRHGNIWFNYGGDIHRFSGNEFTIYDQDALPMAGSLLEDRHGNIWMSSWGKGVIRFDGKQVVYITEEDGLVDNHIGNMKETSTGELWFTNNGYGLAEAKGVSRFIPDGEQTGLPTGTLINYTTESGLSGNRITAMAEDRDGKIWLSTWNDGITRFDAGLSDGQGDRFVHIGNTEGVLSKQLSLFVGRNNVIWAGANGNGLNQIVLSGPRSLTANQSLFGQMWVTAMAEDSEGQIWMARDYDGLIRFDGKTFELTGRDNGFPAEWIHMMDFDNEGNLWIATRDNGFMKFDGAQFTRYSLEQGLGHPEVHGLFVDRDGIVWVSGYKWASGPEGVLYRFDPSTTEISYYSTINYGKARLNPADVYQDRDGMIWIGGLNCVATYNADEDQVELFAVFENPESHQRMPYFMEDNNGNLWVARTPPAMKTEADRFVQLKADGKLLDGDFPVMEKGVHWPDVLINDITLDANGQVWFCSDAGVFGSQDGLRTMARGEANWVNLTKDDGLKGNNTVRLHVDMQNRLWMNHNQSGMTILDLDDFEFPEEIPAGIGLIDIEIGGEHIDFQSIATDTSAGLNHSLAQAIDSLAPFANLPVNLELPHDQNHLTFHFSFADWTAPHAVQYSYMLEGLEEAWSPATAEPKAEYRPIPHGVYTFKVRARGKGNIWSQPVEYSFRILPPWWQTPWAYALYAVLVLGSIGGYIIRLRRKIRLKQEQLDREQYLNRELRELNIATTRFVPKDFVNILNKESLKELHLGDQIDATMTILFADIRGYTELSEGMTPDENFKFINGYVGRMGPIIQEHGGFICQYYGDGMMALFKENHQQAIKAAVAMQRALEEYNKVRVATDRQPFKIGIGINTGHLMLGVIGDEQRYDTSVISDAVNTASRLEGLTKIFGSQIIVSEKTLKEIKDFDHPTGESDYLGSFRFLGRVKVKGKDQTLKVYEVFDGEPESVKEKKRKTAPEFEQAIQYYFDRRFGKAADILKEILEITPDDVAAQYYLDRSVQFIVNGVEEDWSGVEEMVSK